MTLPSLIRGRVVRDPIRYHTLRADIVSARIAMTVERYLTRAILVSAVIGVGIAVIAALIIGQPALLKQTGGTLSSQVIPLEFPATLAGFPVQLLMQAVAILISFLLGAVIAYSLALRYPSLVKKNRATRINLSLHTAVAYMYAMRRGGAQLLVIFRSISDNAKIYGEVALEFRQMVRDADIFGYDVITAIHHLMETTPSIKMKEFLEDMVSVVESGGDLTTFLSGRVRLYQEDARFEQRQFLNFLGMIAESYVSLFVAGPLFLIIIMVVMGMMGGAAIFQMNLVAYALLPIGSGVFIVLIDLVTPADEISERFTTARVLKEYRDVRIEKKDGDEKFFAKLAHYDRVRNIRQFIRHPMDSFVKDYHRTLYATLPVAIVYLTIVMLNAPSMRNLELFIDVVDDQIFICLLIVLIPYGLFYELWRRKVRGIEGVIPDFLERMAGINQVGLTIAQAISILVNTNLGLLSYEIKRIKRDMDWGANFTDALVRFEQRVSTPLIARTVTLVTKANEMSGTIGDVLTIASSDARTVETLKRERLAEMFIYTAIVYLSFFVFLFVVAVLTNQFLTMFDKINATNLPATGALAGLKNLSTQVFERLMYHTCLVQALFSGIIAGQMGESSIASGVKHSCLMIAIALITFNFVI
ncbi:MAG: type II secretion system F family protein [Methanomicrobiales archaeon]|jgi:flagellar protein FlaJ|nr:type II secretion system F family protein [Methanomicrobiales archaeon]